MKLPWTPKPRTASIEELREQLANAKTTHSDALRATGSAQTAFDDTGDASAEKALLAARLAEQFTAEHLARAQRLLDAAETQRTAAARAELERQAAAIQAELSGNDTEETHLVGIEVAAYEAAANARHARRANLVARSARRTELDRIRVQLGQAPRALSSHTFDCEPSHAAVGARLEAAAAGMPGNNPHHRDLLTLATIKF